jgi:anti-sigma regulatory factor (Ser/Thr protein kinase)
MAEVLTVREESQVAEARRRAVTLGDRAGFDATEAGRVAIVATELATNLLKHGDGGVILAGRFEDSTGTGIELIALDRGRGMENLAACLEDGYSTAGSAGQGLGSIRRQSHAFDVATWPGIGTAVLARLSRGRPDGRMRFPRSGAIAVPVAGEEVCGDAVRCVEEDGRVDVLVADGLGHGAGAATAAAEALRVFDGRRGRRPEEVVADLHAALRATRGAAVAVARIDPAAGRVSFCGLGNVVGSIFGGERTQRMISHNGTAGLAMHRIQTFDYPLGPRAAVVMHSDGLTTSWSPDRYTGLFDRHPALAAAVLWRDHNRGRDDSSVAVIVGGRS